jgi:hypothetical protein
VRVSCSRRAPSRSQETLGSKSPCDSVIPQSHSPQLRVVSDAEMVTDGLGATLPAGGFGENSPHIERAKKIRKSARRKKEFLAGVLPVRA